MDLPGGKKQPSPWVQEVERWVLRQKLRLDTGYNVAARDCQVFILQPKEVIFTYFWGKSVDFQSIIINFEHYYQFSALINIIFAISIEN